MEMVLETCEELNYRKGKLIRSRCFFARTSSNIVVCDLNLFRPFSSNVIKIAQSKWRFIKSSIFMKYYIFAGCR